MAARKQAGVPKGQGTDRPNASQHARGRGSQRIREGEDRMFVRGLLTPEAEGLVIVRAPNFALEHYFTSCDYGIWH